MHDWNVLVTVTAGPHHEHDVLGALQRFGEFRRTSFKDVCAGVADDIDALLEEVRRARGAGEPWALEIGRVIPIERTFPTMPESLPEQLKRAVEPLADRLANGSFCVRLERRGFPGRIDSPAIEREIADHVATLAEARGIALSVSLDDPDFLVVAETLGSECGVALIPRALRERYPFVGVR